MEKASTYKDMSILFDFDGTIGDTETPAMEVAFWELAPYFPNTGEPLKYRVLGLDEKKTKRIELYGLTTISSGMRPPSLQPKGTSVKVMALLQDIGGKPSSFYVHHHCSNSFFRVYVFTAGAASMLQENLLLSPPFGLGGSPSCCSGSISVVDVHVFFVSTFLFSLAFASLFGYAG